MNIILFEAHEIGHPLPAGDRRYDHIRSVLKADAGDELRAGLIGGRWGSIRLVSVGSEAIEFDALFDRDPAPLFPLTLMIGAPRPLVSKRLLKDLSSLGADRLVFMASELSEKSYLSSSVWSEEHRRFHLLEGAEQAGSTLLPSVEICPSPLAALRRLGGFSAAYVLDPAACGRLSAARAVGGRRVLAVGPERGWSERELDSFVAAGFMAVRFGDRVLRTEAAALLGAGLLLARMGHL